MFLYLLICGFSSCRKHSNPFVGIKYQDDGGDIRKDVNARPNTNAHYEFTILSFPIIFRQILQGNKVAKKKKLITFLHHRHHSSALSLSLSSILFSIFQIYSHLYCERGIQTHTSAHVLHSNTRILFSL